MFYHFFLGKLVGSNQLSANHSLFDTVNKYQVIIL